MGLEEIILGTTQSDRKPQANIFNNAAQVRKHSFLWSCMRPEGGGEPGGSLGQQIDESFGGLEKFHENFKATAIGQFGSGYVWLVASNGAFQVRRSANAHTPMVDGQAALLACDVWEHAHYLDYQNRRADCVDAFLNHLVNWEFVAAQLGEAAPERSTTGRARAGRR